MKFSVFQESRIGGRRNNQDRLAYSYSRDALLLVIADGMGGHLHGEVAAHIAVQYITEAFQADAAPRIEDPTQFLSRSIINAHYAILDYAGDRLLPEAPRTTCVACVVQDGRAFWAHAGDSRLYLIREGHIVARTRDHSRVQMMVDEGLMTEDDAALHPARNRVFSCLGGTHMPHIDHSPRTALLPGDVIVLATDGAWGPLRSEGLIAGLSPAGVMEAVPGWLDTAEQRAGEDCDNLSMVAMRWEDEYTEESSTRISTLTMPLESFTTQMEGFSRASEGGSAGGDLTDEEIERAIAEIQSAIRKYSK
jgi:serine/threonine protein phosphatase PrpC